MWPGGGGEAGIAGQNGRHQRVVHIDDGRHGVERTFGQCAFAAEAGGGRRLPGQAADEIHEELGQFLIVNRVVDRKRRQTRFEIGGIGAAAGQNCVDRKMQRLPGRDLARQPRADLRDVHVAWIDQIGPLLQIARILRRNAVDDRADGPRRRRIRCVGCATKSSEQTLHRLGVLIELDDVIDDGPGLVHRERLEVGEKGSRAERYRARHPCRSHDGWRRRDAGTEGSRSSRPASRSGCDIRRREYSRD